MYWTLGLTLLFSLCRSDLCLGQEPNIDMDIKMIISKLESKCLDQSAIERKLAEMFDLLKDMNNESEIDKLKEELKHLTNTVNREQTSRQIFEEATTSKIEKLIQSSYNNNLKGLTYIRWGRKECPQNGTGTIYHGFAAGGQYSHGGASTQMLCLPREPIWGKYDSSQNDWGEYLYGVEYEHKPGRANAIFGKSYHDLDVPCAACESERSAHIMIPGRTACYDGWTREYWGYLMGGHYTHVQQRQYYCVDAEPESLDGENGNDNGYLLYFVEVRCGSLRCPPYVLGRELPCVVCTK